MVYIFQKATECTNLFHSNALQDLQKMGIFGLKVYHLATLACILPQVALLCAFFSGLHLYFKRRSISLLILFQKVFR
jgi:ubiquinone biosynthesis protein Coq4